MADGGGWWEAGRRAAEGLGDESKKSSAARCWSPPALSRSSSACAMLIHAYECECVCVCEREREREGEMDVGRQGRRGGRVRIHMSQTHPRPVIAARLLRA